MDYILYHSGSRIELQVLEIYVCSCARFRKQKTFKRKKQFLCFEACRRSKTETYDLRPGNVSILVTFLFKIACFHCFHALPLPKYVSI